MTKSPAAAAADGESPSRFGAAATLTYGFKPEFQQGEDAGRYKLGRLSGRANVIDGLSALLSQSVLSVDAPAPSTQLLDPSLRLGYQPGAVAGLDVSAAVLLTLGLSKESRAADYLGGARSSLGISASLGKLTPWVSGAFTKHVRRYTLTTTGQPVASYALAGSLGLDYAWDDTVSASLGLEYKKTVKYAGAPSYVFSNSLDVAYQINRQLQLGVGLSTVDAQQDEGGRDNNELELYRQNKTEMSFSATYAL